MIDKELTDKIVKGDKVAFAQAISKVDSSVRGYVRKLCSTTTLDYNDLTQDAFIKAYLNLSKYNSRYPFEAWVRIIARNTFIDAVRRDKSLFDLEVKGDIDFGNNPEDLFINLQREEDVESRLSMLPKQYQQIIDLRYFLSLSYNEIAQKLGVPIGTVKTRLFRAKQMLLNILQTLE